MGYIYNLIEKATDTNLNLENNKIGNYRITPQHGNYVAQYFVYKDKCKPHYGEQLVVDIQIYENKIIAKIDVEHLKPFEWHQIQDVLNNLYDGFDIDLKNMY